jgi:hypothetical protein
MGASLETRIDEMPVITAQKVTVYPGEPYQVGDTTFIGDGTGGFYITQPSGMDGSLCTHHVAPVEITKKGKQMLRPAQITVGTIKIASDGTPFCVNTTYVAVFFAPDSRSNTLARAS